MKIYDFNFCLELWIKSLEIEANSYEEALDKLTSMSFEDLISQGYIKDFDITFVDCKVEDDERLLHLYKLYKSEPTTLTEEELQELRDSYYYMD